MSALRPLADINLTWPELLFIARRRHSRRIERHCSLAPKCRRVLVSLPGSKAEPHVRQHAVQRHALALAVNVADVDPGLGVTHAAVDIAAICSETLCHEMGMQLTTQQDERRAYKREYESARQLEIIVDDQEFNTENWSVGGFRSYGLYLLNKNERFAGLVNVPIDGPNIPFTGQIIRVEEDGARIVKLVDIDLDHLLALQEVVTI